MRCDQMCCSCAAQVTQMRFAVYRMHYNYNSSIRNWLQCFFLSFLLVFIVFIRCITFRFNRLMCNCTLHITARTTDHFCKVHLALWVWRQKTYEMNTFRKCEVVHQKHNMKLNFYFRWLKRLILGNHYFSEYDLMNLSIVTIYFNFTVWYFSIFVNLISFDQLKSMNGSSQVQWF